MSELNDNTINMGQACDNCRIKKIKCNHGNPCDRCLKTQEKTRKKNSTSQTQLPLLKCTYEYKINTQKRVVQHSDRRITEKQITILLNDKINMLDNVVLKDERLLNKMSMIKNLDLGDMEENISAKEESKSLFNNISTTLDKLLKTDMNSEKQIIENSIADNYSKIIEYDIRTNAILKNLKDEFAFNFETPCPDKRVFKKREMPKSVKKLGVGYFKDIKPQNNLQPDNRVPHNLYQDQEKEGFDSAFAINSKKPARESLKSKISALTKPEILSNLLKSTNAYSNVAYYLSSIKHLSDLLKSDSELYLKQLLQNIDLPVYLDVPNDLFDLLMKTYNEELQYWNFYITENLLKKLVFHFKQDQKKMTETDLFLMNVILLMACQGLKFNVNSQSNQSEKWDKQNVEEWETVFLLNCLAFYQKFLIFQKPIINSSQDLSMLFEKTLRKLQAFFLLGHYFNNSPCPRLAVHLFSIVTTIGQDFNYDNLGTYGPSLSMELKIQARNLWICSFITEKHISVTFGNPEFILGFDQTVTSDDIFKHSLESQDIKVDFSQHAIPIDYSNANTPWIKFLKKQSNGLLIIGFFLRLQLLQIETVYYKTIVASKNEEEDMMDTLKKAETLIKVYEDFEVIAKTYFDIDSDISIEDWIKRLSERIKDKKRSHNEMTSVDLALYLFMTLYTLKLTCTITILDIRYNQEYNETEEKQCSFVYSLTVIINNQLSILEYLLDNGWSHCASSEIVISYISCLSCLFYNSVLDKNYFKVHIKRMMSIIKKFSSIAAHKYFFDPVKWNTATAHSIFFMRILAACHPEVFEEVLQIDAKTVFYKEYEQAYAGIKNFKTSSFENIKKGRNFIKELKDSERVLFIESSTSSNITTPSTWQHNSKHPISNTRDTIIEKKEKVVMSPFMANTNNFSFSPSEIPLNYMNNSPNKEDSDNTLNSWLFKQSIDNGISNDELDTDARLLNLLDPKYVFSFNEDDGNDQRQTIFEDKNILEDETKFPNEEQMFAVSNDLDSLVKNNFYTSSVFNVDDFLKDDLLFE